MPQPEDNFDLEKSMENFKKSPSKKYFDSDENLSVDNIQVHEQQLKKYLFKFIIYGLVVGVISSIGAVVFLERFGLTNRFNNKPLKTQPKLQKQLPAKQIKFSPHTTINTVSS